MDDKSGNNRHMTQTTFTSQMAYSNNAINGRSALLGAGGTAADFMRYNGTFNISSNHMVFMVSKSTAIFSQGCFQVNKGSSVYGFYRDWESIVAGSFYLTNIGPSLSFDTNVNNVATIYQSVMNATAQTKAAYATGNFVGSNAYTNMPTSLTGVDFHRNADQSPAGYGCEMIIVESTSTELRWKIEGYLAWKWGMVANLPSDHPYKRIKPHKR
jgi:hypothetical protein